MEKKKSAAKKKRRIKKRFIFIIAGCCVLALTLVLYSQDRKMREIAMEKAKLTDEYRSLKTQEEQMEYMIEYAKSDEFLLQYAREVLGYVLPGDTKFEPKS